MSELHAFLAELKRRRVWRVAVVYVVTGLAVIEAADLLLPRLALPDWTVTLVAVLALLGFPIALVLGWAFEVSPAGVRRTEPAPGQALLEPGRRRGLFAGAAGVALLAGGGWWLLAGGAEERVPEIERIAVLPLSNLMNDPEQEYFVQGMHDRLISELQQAGIPVIARTSVMRYGEPGTPVREIARELGVDAVIEGSVFRAGDRVAIEARLVDGATEEYLWREEFGGDLRNVAALHRDLTRAIAGEIRSALVPEGHARVAEASSVDPDAYEAYLKGFYHLQRFTAEDLNAADDYFERALAIDSAYAPAWAGLARSLHRRAIRDPDRPDSDRWKAALERALTLDPELAEAHVMVAMTRAWGEWDWEAGEEAFRRAIALNPAHAEARAFYGHLLSILGRWEEAAEQMETGLELDPLNPFIRGLHAAQLIMARRYEEGIERLRDMLRASPGAGFGRGVLASTLRDLGRHHEALREFRAEYERLGEVEVVAALIRGDEEGGPRRAYRLAAEALTAPGRAIPRSGSSSAFVIAAHYRHAGDTSAAIEWLEVALAERHPGLPYVGSIPTWEPLHDDPRFREIARQVGVPILAP